MLSPLLRACREVGPPLVLVCATMIKVKIVLKVTTGSCKTSVIMRAVAKIEGIDEMTVDMESGKLTVIGIVDPLCIVKALKKIKVVVGIESINPHKPEKPKPKPCPVCMLVPCLCVKCPSPCKSVPCLCGKCRWPCKSVPCHCGKCPSPCKSVPCHCGKCPSPCKSVPCHCGKCPPPCPPPCPQPCWSVPCHCGKCPPPCPPPCRSAPCNCGTCHSGYPSRGCEDPSGCIIV